jgi:hypothetical protein
MRIIWTSLSPDVEDGKEPLGEKFDEVEIPPEHRKQAEKYHESFVD